MNTKTLPVLSALVLFTQVLLVSAQYCRLHRTSANASGLPGTQPTYIPDGSISPSASAPQARTVVPQADSGIGLPRCLSSPYMDGYGDHVRSDLGHRIDGAPLQRSGKPQSGGATIGLPRCISSPYMDGYGDHVRSDFGHRIDGSPMRRAVARPVPSGVQQPQQRQLIYSYSDPLTPAYKRSN